MKTPSLSFRRNIFIATLHAFIVCLLIYSVPSAFAGMTMTFQPNQAGNQLVVTVVWDKSDEPLEGKSDFPDDAPVWTEVPYINYELVYDHAALLLTGGSDFLKGHGIGGVVSVPAGYGVNLYNYGSDGTDLYFFSTTTGGPAIPQTGSVVITVPVSGQPLAGFNLGSYNIHPDCTVTITNTPYVAPSPTTYGTGLTKSPSEISSFLELAGNTTSAERKFYFDTTPGHRYNLWRSTNLSDWEKVTGYPKVADSLSMEHDFPQQTREFFRVEPIDEQAPVITSQYPSVDGFAVGRFADLNIQLADVSGIDPSSVRLSVGASGEMQQGHAGLTIAGNTITYDSGDAALGTWGQTLTATLVVADTLGHSISHTWNFRLETLANVTPNLFVFGSVAAQRAGQLLPVSAASAVARQRDGRVPMTGADPWSISAVNPASVVITYTGDTPPIFVANTYLANRTPANVNDIFYRKISNVTHDAAAKTVTLGTVDVDFAEIVPDGAIEVNDQTIAYDVDQAGNIQRAISFDKTFTTEPVGFNRDGYGPVPLSGSPAFTLSLPVAHVTAKPTLRVALETRFGVLQEASIDSTLVVDAALTAALQLQGSVSSEASANLHAPVLRPVSLGSIGPVPVWVDLTYTTSIKAVAEASASVTLSGGWQRQFTCGAGVSYEKDRTPKVIYHSSSHDTGNLWQPIVLSGSASARARVSIEPKLDAKIWSIAGFWFSVDPGYETNVTANGALTFYPQNGTISPAGSLSATLSRGFGMNVQAGFSVLGLSGLPQYGPKPLIESAPSTYNFSSVQQIPLAFATPTANQTLRVLMGNAFTLHAEARGGPSPIQYRWYQNNRLVPGAVSPSFTVSKVQTGNQGTYTVRATQENTTVTSPQFEVTIVPIAQSDPLRFISPTVAQTFTKTIGESVSFEVVVAGGTGLYQYQWLKNGIPLPNQSSFSVIGFNSVSLADEGIYSVKVTAGGSTITSPEFSLNVVDPSVPVEILNDTFSGSALDSSKWTGTRSSVIVSGGLVVMRADVTDQFGILNSSQIPFNKVLPITLTRRVKLHYSNSYSIPSLHLNIGSLPKVMINYGNMAYGYAPHRPVWGIVGSRNNQHPHSVGTEADCFSLGNVIWDQWFEEKIVYNPNSGFVEHFVNNTLRGSFFAGLLPSNTSQTLTLRLDAGGWHTGHEHAMDWIIITQ